MSGVLCGSHLLHIALRLLNIKAFTRTAECNWTNIFILAPAEKKIPGRKRTASGKP